MGLFTYFCSQLVYSGFIYAGDMSLSLSLRVKSLSLHLQSLVLSLSMNAQYWSSALSLESLLTSLAEPVKNWLHFVVPRCSFDGSVLRLLSF